VFCSAGRVCVAISLSAAATSAGAVPSRAAAQALKCPTTRKGADVDNYFGTKVADPYRWLEDQNAPAAAAWVDAENKVTFAYLATNPFRDAFTRELTTLTNVPRVSTPFPHRGAIILLEKHRIAKSIRGVRGERARRRATADRPKHAVARRSTELSGYSPSPDGPFVAYSQSVGGLDWSDTGAPLRCTRRCNRRCTRGACIKRIRRQLLAGCVHQAHQEATATRASSRLRPDECASPQVRPDP
jgi:prolyl oligopeptidase